MRYIHGRNCKGFAIKGSQNCNCLKDRGYAVQAEIAPGTMVELYEDFEVGPRDNRLLPGEVVQVETYSNMGFLGIEVWLHRNDGSRATCPAGMIVRADGGASYRDAVMAEYERRRATARAAVQHMVDWAKENGIPMNEELTV